MMICIRAFGSSNTLGHRIRQGGYDVAYGGKVHLPSQMADVRKLGYEVLTSECRNELAQQSASFIKQGRERPFFLFASFENPHDICYMAINDYHRRQGQKPVQNIASYTCEKLLAEAPTDKKDLPELPDSAFGEISAVRRQDPEVLEEFRKQRPFKHYAYTQWSEKQWRLHRWLYCRLTELVDKQVGTLLEALDDSGQLEDTVIIFTSDHGDVDGAHRMEHKTVFYEEALRIPFIVTQKGTTPDIVDTTHFVNNGLDLLPTLCDYANVESPPGLLGYSVRPLAEGESPSYWRDKCVIESEIGKYMITERWKYCRLDFAGEEEVLIDRVEDPEEIVNLAGDPAYSDALDSLRNELEEWEHQTSSLKKERGGDGGYVF